MYAVSGNTEQMFHIKQVFLFGEPDDVRFFWREKN